MREKTEKSGRDEEEEPGKGLGNTRGKSRNCPREALERFGKGPEDSGKAQEGSGKAREGGDRPAEERRVD
jgi:hypothetical protein